MIGFGFFMVGFFVDRECRFNVLELLCDWLFVDICGEFEMLFDFFVLVENNGMMGVIGELVVGVGWCFLIFGYFLFNYGFGGGIVLDGRFFFGVFGNVGEISCVFIVEEGFLCFVFGELFKCLNVCGVEIVNICELC